jgi:hypothetical protein
MARLLAAIGRLVKEKPMPKHTIFVGVCLLLAVILGFGCGKRTPRMESGRGQAIGTITFDGKPLRGGTIFIVSAKNPICQVAVSIKPDGTFSVADAPTGEVLIAVDNESQKGNNPQAYVALPAKYKSVKTSGLKFNVGGKDAGDAGLKIELTSK